MENRLDQLFRNQLFKHLEEPSPQSWDQIQEQLTSRRRAIWMRRLVVAASITLFAVVTFFAYRSLNMLPTDPSIEVVDAESARGNDPEVRSTDTVTSSRETLNQEEKVANAINPIDTESHSAAPESNDNSVIDPIEQEENSRVLAEAADKPIALEEEETENDLEKVDDSKIEEPAAHAELPLELDADVEHPQLAENTIPVEPIEKSEVQQEEKTYPKVQIVFKADKESELVASNNTTIFTKGINKIAEFSEEHILTADRKTRLRNTKDDLLALNFGKLLNKSNKELEN